MIKHLILSCLLGLAAILPGCNSGPYKEPTVDAFTGRLLSGGSPVSFDPGDVVRLQLSFHKNGERFGIPIQPDGTFKIGWMPIGKYSATLEIEKPVVVGKKTPPKSQHPLPDGFEIVEGKTDYEIDLGKGFKA